MRWSSVLCLLLLIGCRRGASDAQASKQPGMPAAATPSRVGSAAFHLEIGGIHERFEDVAGAVEHFSRAAALAEDPASRSQAYSALGRAKEAAGDVDGAIEALERARVELERVGKDQPIVPGGEDVLIRLARLEAGRGRVAEALSLCERALSAAANPWQRDQLQRLEVELHRKAGTLAKRLSAAEKALERSPGDDAALRFVRIALADDGPQGPSPTPTAEARSREEKLIRVYGRLIDLHPDDSQLRRTLQELLERAGRTDDAVKLVTAAPAADPMACASALAQPPPSATLQGAIEAIRIRARAGQSREARAQTEKLAGLAGREGAAAYVAAADLLLEQGAPERAVELISRTARNASSPEERRQLSIAQERISSQAGRTGEAKALLAQWKRSEDPCLRLVAAQREQQQALVATSPPGTPSATTP